MTRPGLITRAARAAALLFSRWEARHNKMDPAKWGITVEEWRSQWRYADQMAASTLTPPPPAAARPRPLPPKYTIWIEALGEEDKKCDVLETAETLEGAIKTAAEFARRISAMIIIVENESGNGWAVQPVSADDLRR